MSFLLDAIALLALGALVRWLAQRIFRDNPWGILPASALTWGVGAVLAGSFLFASLGLYLDLWDFGPIEGPDWQLNSGLPLGLMRSWTVDIVAAFLFLLYPVYYVVGAAAAERLGGLSFPAIREPIDLDAKRSIIAIADTHLGLAPNALARAVGGAMQANPTVVMQFLQWLATDPLGSVAAWTAPPGGSEGKVVQRKLQKPQHLVMCGDTLELWDAPDESVQLAMSTLMPALQRIDAESVFVLGNHDSVLSRDATVGAGGFGSARIARDVWPGADGTDPLDPSGRGIRPIRAGDRQYIFLHGHQFDPGFQALGPLSLVPGHLRQAARFGYYALLFTIPLALVFALAVMTPVPSSQALAGIVAFTLTLLLVPLVYMTLGRFLWQRLGGGRYHADRAIKGFRTWWTLRAGGGRYRRGVAAAHDDLTIVYGHTHMADLIDLRPVEEGGRRVGLPLLLNLPSWITDPGKEQERSMFLYVDAGGYLMLGWDWTARKPFHVPDALLVARRRKERPPFEEELRQASMTMDDLRHLDWPSDFQEKWARVGLRGLTEPA